MNSGSASSFTPSQLPVGNCLNRTKDMLQDPANNIASIAYECGYNDPGYFAKVFKQEYGETPQEWRSVKSWGRFFPMIFSGARYAN